MGRCLCGNPTMSLQTGGSAEACDACAALDAAIDAAEADPGPPDRCACGETQRTASEHAVTYGCGTRAALITEPHREWIVLSHLCGGLAADAW